MRKLTIYFLHCRYWLHVPHAAAGECLLCVEASGPRSPPGGRHHPLRAARAGEGPHRGRARAQQATNLRRQQVGRCRYFVDAVCRYNRVKWLFPYLIPIFTAHSATCAAIVPIDRLTNCFLLQCIIVLTDGTVAKTKIEKRKALKLREIISIWTKKLFIFSINFNKLWK